MSKVGDDSIIKNRTSLWGNPANKINELCAKIKNLSVKVDRIPNSYAFLSIEQPIPFTVELTGQDFRAIVLPETITVLVESKNFILKYEGTRFFLEYIGKKTGKFFITNNGTLRNVGTGDTAGFELLVATGMNGELPDVLNNFIREDVRIAQNEESTEVGSGIITLDTNDTVSIFFSVEAIFDPIPANTVTLLNFMLILNQIE